MRPKSSAAKPAPKPRVAAKLGNQVRIIGGKWKRTKLKVVDAAGLRPTPDRVRETLFNWLGQDLQGLRCLDAFAGTGALGFEAASRGAAHVTLVEQESQLVEQLKRTQTQLDAQAVSIQRGDGLAALRHAAAGSLHLIFLDPPFASNLWESALTAARKAIAPNGQVYLEAPAAWGAEALGALGWSLHRHLKAGAVHAHVLRPLAAESQATAAMAIAGHAPASPSLAQPAGAQP
ncbi:MAG: 16S rRNA (guanine(966)-N(2))-methyltransferase RsmD [Rhodoferax sp.]|nr:16S rRNA (guanine(966)-N(2))-methyltransferase RsmD [Rhodoferax sp.]